jgi:hypothetical protein
MKYYRAQQQDTRPYLVFKLVAESLEDLVILDLDNDELVVEETLLTDDTDPDYISYEFGICHKRVFEGKIVDRLGADIAAQSVSLNISTEVLKTKNLEAALNLDTFLYDGRDFPLTSAARSVYTALFDQLPTSQGLITTTGTYTMLAANVPGFKSAYFTSIFASNDSFSAS